MSHLRRFQSPLWGFCAALAAGWALQPAALGEEGGKKGASSPVELLRTPNEGIQPQAVIDATGTVHLLYYRGEIRAGDLYYVRRRPGQPGWSAALRVNSQAASAVAGGTIRGGQLAVGAGSRPHVVWFGSQQAQPRGPAEAAPAGATHGPMNTPLLYSRLNEAGTAFEPQRNLMQYSLALDGGPSVAADAKGNVWVLWHAAESPGGGAEARRVFMVHSRDDGRSFPLESPIATEFTGACPCCSIKAFADGRGNLYALYRMTERGTERDMVLLASADTGRTFRATRLDPWSINTCPMSSQSFAEGPRGIYGAWETRGQVRYARFAPGASRPDATVTAPGAGPNRKHPAIAVNARSEVLFAWTEGTSFRQGGDLAWQVFDDQGKGLAVSGRRVGGIPASSLPTAAALPDGRFLLVH